MIFNVAAADARAVLAAWFAAIDADAAYEMNRVACIDMKEEKKIKDDNSERKKKD